MKNLSKFQISMIIAFSVVLVLGVAGWWYTGTLRAEAADRMAAANTDKLRLQRAEYVPSAGTVAVLEEKIAAIGQTLQPLETQVLDPESDQLARIQTMIPTVWQERVLRKTVGELRELAASSNIKLPLNEGGLYFFGFDRYIDGTPQQDAIVLLTKQLLAVQKAFQALAAAGGVRELNTIRRAFVEEGDIQHSNTGAATVLNRGGSNKDNPERLQRNREVLDNGLYEVIPLEFDFTGDPNSLRQFLNGLASAELLYVVRSVSTTTTNTQSPRFSELKDQYDGQDRKDRIPAFGRELVKARVRFDLVDWLGGAKESETEETTQQAQR
ncbi:MAG: hypothetical protein AAGK14_09720 [Verrucomicrobiota bacterium]